MRPYQVLIFLAAVMAILGGLYWAFPEEEATDAMEVLEVVETMDTIPADTIVPDEPQPQPVAVVIPKVNVDSTTDSRIFLKTFYASLAQANERVVRVLHYGDSQIEEDRMSQQIREALQNQYGGAGAGLMPLAQTIPSRTVRQQLYMNDRFTMPAQGPRRYLVYGPKRDQREDGLYGVMGQVAVMNDSLVRGSEEIMAVCTPLDGRKRYTKWQLFADESISDSIVGDTVWLRGRGNVYGLSQESETGVIVDNIPMRGCLGLVFNKIDSAQLASFYSEQNVRLIILQFGGNAIPSNRNPGTIQGIVKGLRQQVQLIRSLAPEASILFIGPSDMITQTDGEWSTYPMVPYMDRLLRKMALEENIAYFSLYRWMGGAGSMLHWQEIGLAGSDGVHFTRAGARKAGNAVAHWILDSEELRAKTEE
jgi:lysophospholipase L1-like esterase